MDSVDRISYFQQSERERYATMLRTMWESYLQEGGKMFQIKAKGVDRVELIFGSKSFGEFTLKDFEEFSKSLPAQLRECRVNYVHKYSNLIDGVQYYLQSCRIKDRHFYHVTTYAGLHMCEPFDYFLLAREDICALRRQFGPFSGNAGGECPYELVSAKVRFYQVELDRTYVISVDTRAWINRDHGKEDARVTVTWKKGDLGAEFPEDLPSYFHRRFPLGVIKALFSFESFAVMARHAEAVKGGEHE